MSLSYRDPTSIFFRPTKAFAPGYSRTRQVQARTYVQNASPSAQSARSATDHRLCVGIVSVQRPELYLDIAIGSLLEGLAEDERNDIYLIAFIANTDPHDHISYQSPWLHDLVDRVLTYDDIPSERKAELAKLEREDIEHRVKPLLDYIHLLQTCAATGAEHVLMLEDDVIAAANWFHQTNTTLQSLEQHRDFDRTLYLCLFYTSHLLGWNSEHWLIYAITSSAAALTSFALLWLLYRCHGFTSKVLTPNMIRIIVLVHVPAFILLYFAAGRLTVAPLRRGLRPMDEFGCCSQALVFPSRAIPDLVNFYQGEGIGFVDVLTESFAESLGLRRWALVPSVFQHIGGKSSKGDDYESSRWNRSVAANIWNFDFELFDVVN